MKSVYFTIVVIDVLLILRAILNVRKDVRTRRQAGEVFWYSLAGFFMAFVPIANLLVALFLISAILYENADKFFINLKD